MCCAASQRKCRLEGDRAPSFLPSFPVVKGGPRMLGGAFTCAVFFVLFSVSVQAFPDWMGVYGEFQRHNGVNPGRFTILMNQDYWGLHAEVGIRINSGSWNVYPMDYAGNVDGNSLWQYDVPVAYASNDLVQFYFHGWDFWDGHIYDNNGDWNYSFTAGAAELYWVGQADLPVVVAGRDARVGIESWPRGSGIGAFSLYAADGGPDWGGALLPYTGVSGANDLWRGSLGRFSVSSEVQVVFGVEDEAGYTLYDNNQGSNYTFTVQMGDAVEWVGNVHHFPTNGALTSDDNLWMNFLAWPSQTVVRADVLYAVNGMVWEFKEMAYWQMSGNDEWWHANLGRMPPGSVVYYFFEIEDGSGAWHTIPSNGVPLSAQVAGSPVDSDGDGLPDDWEIYWFGHLDYAGSDNPDNDGLPGLPIDNWLEHGIGTDPAHSNNAQQIRLLWFPSRPFKGGWVRLSVHVATNEAIYGDGILLDFDQHDGAGMQTMELDRQASGRFEGSKEIAVAATRIELIRLTGNGATNNNQTLGWEIPVRSLAPGELADSDGDGLPDWWEILHGLDPLDDGTLNPDNGPDGDLSGDGITNIEVYEAGGDPHVFYPVPSIKTTYPKNGARIP